MLERNQGLVGLTYIPVSVWDGKGMRFFKKTKVTFGMLVVRAFLFDCHVSHVITLVEDILDW